MFELSLLGIIVGLLSGFFGIGGGTIMVPMLLILGYDIKVAIGISVVQMAFSSIYGSYLNNKKGTLDIAMISVIGLGGFAGALLSGYITAAFSDTTLELIFLSFAIFALIRLFVKQKEYGEQKEVSKVVLLSIGVVLGAFSMAIGVGGSIVLVPILAGFLHVPLKKAISAGLFFVVFSSISGLISHTIQGHIDYKSGIMIGLASLVGVYLGVHLKERANIHWHRRLIVLFYLLIVSYLTVRIFL